jgi:hypothetical protein
VKNLRDADAMLNAGQDEAAVLLNGREVETGEQFVGMILGDYSKTGINVSIPTGAVLGFCSSVLRPLSPKFVPSFAWVDADGVRGPTTSTADLRSPNG